MSSQCSPSSLPSSPCSSSPPLPSQSLSFHEFPHVSSVTSPLPKKHSVASASSYSECISLLPILLGVIFIPSWPPAEADRRCDRTVDGTGESSIRPRGVTKFRQVGVGDKKVTPVKSD